MNAAAVLSAAQRLGARLSVTGDKLRVEAPAPLPGDLRAELRAHKRELLALLATDDVPDPENVRESYQERAAMMEYDGGLSREDAERQAWARALIHFHLPAGYRLH